MLGKVHMAKKKEFVYDVFISYSHQNQDWVKNTLLAKLEQAGLKVFIDYQDFEIGESAPDAMERAVTTSKQTIIVLSPAYLKSNWAKFENLMLQVMDPANQKRQLIPILLEKCKIPLRLSTFTYADFTKIEGVDLAWQKLFKALKVSTPALVTPIAVPAIPHDPSHWHLAHPYPMPPNFTGRVAERTMLNKWLDEDNENHLFIIRALGGFGKSALTWYWLTHDVDPKEWTKLVWWSFYEGDASFEHFIEETLKYLKLEVPQGQRPQVDELLKAMQSQKILLIMDGFERALRAYSSMNAAYQGDEEPKLEDNQLDCVNINAEIFLKSICSLPSIKSKVLMTTRLTPRAVKPRSELMLGGREEELTAMQKADAVEFFRKQKIKGTHAEIETACAPYGYHPLSLCLLAGRILKDFEKPADIIVAQKLKIDGDIKQQKHHVLEVSYTSLPPDEQSLLNTIACFRSPVELKTLETITEDKNSLNGNLHDLVERGLLHFDNENKKFDLHPIVRRFAYNRLTAPEQTGAHVILVVYFEAVPRPQKVEKLEDIAPIIELYHHMVRAEKLDEACDLYGDRLADTLLFQFGAYQNIIELLRALFPDVENSLPLLKNERAKGRTLTWLANAYSLSGQPHYAVPLYKLSIGLDEKHSDKKNLAIDLMAVASVALLPVGSLGEAERNMRRSIDLSREIENEFYEAIGYQNLGRILFYRGMWQEAETVHNMGIELARKKNNKQIECVITAYSAYHALLLKNYPLAIEKAQIAKRLADIPFPNIGKIPRDQIRAVWILGAIYCAIGNLTKAEENLSESIGMCRQINMVDYEANILLDLARLRYDQKNYEEAKSLAEEALLITERCGYVLQGADVNLFLAQYAQEQEQDKAKAKEYVEEAKKLATCDGPPYYYKVAYEEAERMLESLK
jgi:tetratricopeptide (TPR) repeat protein